MRLLSLRLTGEYKGLKDQYFDFHNTNGSVVALIGLNGSGKSQLLELVAEIISFLERDQRSDFVVKTPLGFGFELMYEIGKAPSDDDVNSSSASAVNSELSVSSSQSTYIYKIQLSSDSKDPKAFTWKTETWVDVPNNNVRLPYIVGYSSGLNENMQRSFMKNAVQYFEIQRIRQRYRKELAGNLEVSQYSKVTEKFLHRHPHIFKDAEVDSSDGSLFAKESDTPISKAIYIDYDSASLMLACLVVLPSDEVEDLLEDVIFKHPQKLTLRYDFGGGVIEKGAIQDIKILIRIAGEDGYCGEGDRSTNEQFELYDLDYLSGIIYFDLSSDQVVNNLREANYGDPRVLFGRLYKIQQLGVKNIRYESRLQLQKDNFFGTVKKPLKTKLPLGVAELILSDGGGRSVSFDDLSDGEAQLIQILATTRVFSSNRTLFLYDEPETHLNPAWRTYFHSYLNKALKNRRETSVGQVLLSTHSPFMLSSLKREDVLLFEREEGGAINMQPVDSQTFGASFDVLIKKHFGLRSLISQTAVQEVKDHLPNEGSQNTQESASAWIEENLGESMEKAYLLRKLKG